MELSFGELSLGALDRLSIEAVVLFVGDARPLPGLAGLCDWRLCGSLSRTLASGWYQGKAGEALLTPTRGRLGAARLFAFGVGDAAGAARAMGELLPHTFVALRRAGIESCCLSPPWPGLELAASLDLWARHAAEGPTRQHFLGDAKAFQRWLEAQGGRFPGVRWQPAEGAALRASGVDGTLSRAGRDRSGS